MKKHNTLKVIDDSALASIQGGVLMILHCADVGTNAAAGLETAADAAEPLLGNTVGDELFCIGIDK